MKRILFFVILAAVALWGCNVEPAAELANEDQIEIRDDIMSRASAPGEGVTTVSPGLVDGYLFTEIDYTFMISPNIVYNYLMGETVQSFYMSIRKYLGNGTYGRIEAESNSMGLIYDFTPSMSLRDVGGPGLYVVEIQIVTGTGTQLIFYDLYDVIDPRPVITPMGIRVPLHTQIPYTWNATSSYPGAQISWEIRRGSTVILGPMFIPGVGLTPYYGNSVDDFVFWSPATYTIAASITIGQWIFSTEKTYSAIDNPIKISGPNIPTINPPAGLVMELPLLSNVAYQYAVTSNLPGLLEWTVTKDATGDIIPVIVGRNDTMTVTFPSVGFYTIKATINGKSTNVKVQVGFDNIISDPR